MSRIGCFLCACAAITCALVEAQDDLDVRRSVVKVFCTSNQLNLSAPWKRGSGGESSGSGMWLGGRRILTNEHVVNYATQISVQLYESAERIPAEVVVASPEMDLAIIELDSEDAFEGMSPPTFADELPLLQSTVRVFGYPEGGNSLSITQGIVSRIEYRSYFHGENGLRVQVDAAINPGNSGGPALVDNRVIGIAFQRRTQSDNIGYLIPANEVQAFLKDVEDGRYGGKPELPIVYQHLLNRNLRSSLGLERDITGVWVRELNEKVTDYPIRVGDIVTHIGEHDIDSSGQTRLRDDVRVNFEYFVSQLATDGSVPLRVFRAGESISIDAPVNQPPTRLLSPLKGQYPEYFVYGPLVFLGTSGDYISQLEALSMASDAGQRMSAVAGMTLLSWRRSPLLTRRYDYPEFEAEELIMVATWLPHRIGIGYPSPATQVIREINGVKIKNLKHLVETLRDLEGEYVSFEFAEQHVDTLVFNREEIKASTDEILLDNGIPRQASPALLKIWEAAQP